MKRLAHDDNVEWKTYPSSLLTTASTVSTVCVHITEQSTCTFHSMSLVRMHSLSPSPPPPPHTHTSPSSWGKPLCSSHLLQQRKPVQSTWPVWRGGGGLQTGWVSSGEYRVRVCGHARHLLPSFPVALSLDPHDGLSLTGLGDIATIKCFNDSPQDSGQWSKEVCILSQ